MEGAAFLASSANFSGNGGSTIFSDNYVRQHFQDGAEGAGYGVAVSLGGSTTYVQEGAYITLLGDDNHLGFEGVDELLLQTDLAGARACCPPYETAANFAD